MDDLEQPKKKTPLKDLEPLSIEALGEYINELNQEIDRVKGAIEFKEKARLGAESFFNNS